MKGNDISNRQAPFILFDIDSLLFEERKAGIIDIFTGIFKSTEIKYLERDFDKTFVRTLTRVWNKHNVSVGLVTFTLQDDELIYYLMGKLDSQFVPYTTIRGMSSWEEVHNFPHMYFFSANEELISYLSSKHAMHISKIWEVL